LEPTVRKIFMTADFPCFCFLEVTFTSSFLVVPCLLPPNSPLDYSPPFCPTYPPPPRYIDEIDSLLSSREGADDSSHGTLTSVKTTMMAEWDGLRTTTDRVVVIGSTNRLTRLLCRLL